MTEFSVPDREGRAYCALTPVELEQVLKTNAKAWRKIRNCINVVRNKLDSKVASEYGTLDQKVTLS
jgi:hypothetical protein